MKIDIDLIDDVEVDGIDAKDYPKFCDAFISYASYNGNEMSDEMLDFINDEMRDFVYDKVYNHLF
jgi:hypothetical protein